MSTQDRIGVVTENREVTYARRAEGNRTSSLVIVLCGVAFVTTLAVGAVYYIFDLRNDLENAVDNSLPASPSRSDSQ